MSDKEKYLADTPVKTEKQDCFQRYYFSKRIAQTIIHRKVSESIVIGIYGEWGEGKSSVLRFIEDNLKKDPNIIVCNFNPWRFKDELQLLKGYFNLLSSQLKRSIQTKSERIGEFISEYADTIIPELSLLGGVIGTNPGSIVKKAADKYSNISIEEQKERIEKILSEEKKKVVVIIDDIDRLDRKEIQAIFKLVKLTGDFSFTSYILAFDDKMVAKAIGEMYENGDEQAGKNYLEKIIQVPLRLPLAQKEALKNFCFERVDNAIQANDIELTKDEAQRFVNHFVKYFLPHLATPRIAIRFCNALSFSMPLLYKEVNIVDLMLIEGVKVFFPELYDFIRNNPEIFTNSYSSLPTHSSSYDNAEHKRKEKTKEQINKILEVYNSNSILSLLSDLFPILKDVYHNYMHGDRNHTEWYKDKRIVSPHYFKRYFAYTVIKGEISDVSFQRLLNYITTHNDDENEKYIGDYITNIDPGNLVSKLRWNEDKYSSDLSEKLILSLSKLGNKFPNNTNSFFGFDKPLRQLVDFINHLFENITDHTEQLNIAKRVIDKSIPTELSIQLMLAFQRPQYNDDDNRLFSDEELKEIGQLLLDRILYEANDVPLFEVFPEDTDYIFTYLWLPIKGKESIMEYIKPILDKHSQKIVDILKYYSPLIHSTRQSEPYYGDLKKDNYINITKAFNVDYLYKLAVKTYGKEIDMDDYTRLDNHQTNENRVKQFVYFYKESKRQTQDKDNSVD